MLIHDIALYRHRFTYIDGQQERTEDDDALIEEHIFVISTIQNHNCTYEVQRGSCPIGS